MKIFKTIGDNSVSKKQLRYLPQSVQLEESLNPHLIRLTMQLMSLAILLFIVWASVTNIREVAQSTGQIEPEGFVQIVQHLQGGMVTNIHVEEGALVEEGDILMTLDDGSSRQDMAQVQARLKTLKLKALRLKSLLSDVPFDLESLEDVYAQEEYSRALEQLEKDKEHLSNMENVLKTKQANLALATASLNSSQKIYDEGYLSQTELRDTQKDLNEADNEVLTIKSNISQAVSNFYAQLEETEDLIAQDSEIITKLEQRVKRLNVLSPVRGVVKGLEINSLGSVVKAGQTLMEIVPLDRPLIARVKISPRDIGHIQIGQDVRLKIGAFDFARYGSVDGKVTFLSATTFEDDGHYYMGRISLSKNYVGTHPTQNIIMPGMRVEGDILTGEKSVLAYLLKPIRNSLQTALTER